MNIGYFMSSNRIEKDDVYLALDSSTSRLQKGDALKIGMCKLVFQKENDAMWQPKKW